MGQSDLDIRIDVVPNGAQMRLFARQAAGVELAFDTGEGELGNLYYYNGTLYTIGTFTAMTNAAHTVRLVVKGNVVTGYIDGVAVVSGSPPVGMITSGTASFGESGTSSPGTARFDNFVVKTAP